MLRHRMWRWIIVERISRLGASVTGIDVTKRSIEIAKTHALNSSLNINYIKLILHHS